MSTISDVAREAGVGVGTVSRVLNGGKSVNEKTRRLVEEAISKLAYTPNSSAKRLRQNKSGVIALMIPVLYHPFFSRFAEAAEQEADSHGYSMLLVASQQHVEKEKRIIERIKRTTNTGRRTFSAVRSCLSTDIWAKTFRALRATTTKRRKRV